MDLLDLMVPPTPPKWRGGVAIPAQPYVRAEHGDLTWMAHDYRDHRAGGRWFWFDGNERIWRCVDPLDQCGINTVTDRPPPVTVSGGFAGR